MPLTRSIALTEGKGPEMARLQPKTKTINKGNNMRYIAVRTKQNQYKFINITKIKQQAEDVAAVFMIFAVVYLMMFI